LRVSECITGGRDGGLRGAHFALLSRSEAGAQAKFPHLQQPRLQTGDPATFLLTIALQDR